MKPLLAASFDADMNFHAREVGPGLAEQSARLFGSAEAREAMAAFLAKRPPRWAKAPGHAEDQAGEAAGQAAGNESRPAAS